MKKDDLCSSDSIRYAYLRDNLEKPAEKTCNVPKLYEVEDTDLVKVCHTQDEIFFYEYWSDDCKKSFSSKYKSKSITDRNEIMINRMMQIGYALDIEFEKYDYIDNYLKKDHIDLSITKFKMRL